VFVNLLFNFVKFVPSTYMFIEVVKCVGFYSRKNFGFHQSHGKNF